MEGPYTEGTEQLVFNGIDADTGHYSYPPMTPEELASLVRTGPSYLPPGWAESTGEAGKGFVEDIDAGDLSQTGWGIVFPEHGNPEVEEALASLIQHRQQQAEAENKQRFRLFSGKDGYHKGESAADFLDRCGVSPGPVDPDQVPYYLLLVGDPSAIPIEFQYGLDLLHAVGRLHLEDPSDYYSYAQAVIAAESGQVRRARTAAFFAPQHPGDQATALSASDLATPLAQSVRKRGRGWEASEVTKEAATKERLKSLIGGNETPAFLFTVTHGLMYKAGSPRQRELQGALLCQGWQGPGNPVDYGNVFSATDLTDGADVFGMVAFHLACFSAGTPTLVDYPIEGRDGRVPLATEGFLSRLSQRLLAHPRGSALAVIGHMERAFGWSYSWVGQGHGFAAFDAAVRRLLTGSTVGHAMEHFHNTYAVLSAALREELSRPEGGSDHTLARLWTAMHDARNYVLLGDPAVHLAVAPLLEGK